MFDEVCHEILGEYLKPGSCSHRICNISHLNRKEQKHLFYYVCIYNLGRASAMFSRYKALSAGYPVSISFHGEIEEPIHISDI